MWRITQVADVPCGESVVCLSLQFEKASHRCEAGGRQSEGRWVLSGSLPWGSG